MTKTLFIGLYFLVIGGILGYQIAQPSPPAVESVIETIQPKNEDHFFDFMFDSLKYQRWSNLALREKIAYVVVKLYEGYLMPFTVLALIFVIELATQKQSMVVRVFKTRHRKEAALDILISVVASFALAYLLGLFCFGMLGISYGFTLIFASCAFLLVLCSIATMGVLGFLRDWVSPNSLYYRY